MLLISGQAVDTINEDWVRGANWIVREHGSGTRSSFEDVLRDRGIDPADLDIAMTLPSNEAVRSAVEAGAGVAVLSELVVRRALAAGTFMNCRSRCLPARPEALRHKERYRTRAADALTELVKEFG
jgi:DNA-binding transcriptional LysR family regulator